MKPLRLLLDQMLDVEVADALTHLGHDVVRVSEKLGCLVRPMTKSSRERTMRTG